MKNQIEGIIVPILTPVREDETPELQQLKQLTNYIVDGGINAIFVNGTTGEFARFSGKERADILGTILETVNGRIPVLAGVSDCGTRLVMENIRRAEAAGADAVVTTLPYYFPTTSIYEQITFIQDIAASTKLPVILYNIPAAAGCQITQQALDEVCDIPNLYGIKDTSGNVDYLNQLQERYSTKLKIFVGDEKLNFYGLRHGADGLVPSLANPFPKLLAAAWKAAKEENWEACKTHCTLVNTMNALNSFSDSWMSPNIWRKEALKQMGIINATFTKPYSPMTPEDKEKVTAWVSYYKKHYI